MTTVKVGNLDLGTRQVTSTTLKIFTISAVLVPVKIQLFQNMKCLQKTLNFNVFQFFGRF